MEPSVHTALEPTGSVQIPNKVYFRIGDVAELVGVKPYVLRYWETEFPLLQPDKSNTGQRVYRRTDVETLLLIKHLLYTERYSIEGARKRIRELKRDGQFKSFKQEKVYGGEDPHEKQLRALKIKSLAEDILRLSKKPIHDIFKF
ncbi:MAG: MerR family transcriptional regulator [Bdellovibrionaceae bacterium]|nr:MerR family transcriptional regulator [Pseudobdellovibrionaceae bacterium]|tara:strand:- start:1945 stop:2379 length:435 start_codon:yes stop_codon:yes gene_type:complete